MSGQSGRTAGAVRSHVTGAAAVAGFFFVALVLLILATRPDGAPTEPTPQPTPEAEPQETLLVQVTLGRERSASLLTATGGEPDVAVLLPLPQDLLLVDGPTYTPLLDANLSLNRRLTARATDNTLGVRVEGGWRMERKALAGLVDSVGGVTVDLPEPAAFLDIDGQQALALPAGESRLAGPDASWYAIGTIEGEDPIVGVQQRSAEVFLKAVQKLPDDADEVSAMLTSLGALSDPLNGTGAVAEYLIRLRERLLDDRVRQVVLPLRTSLASDPVTTRQELEGGPAAAVGAFRVVQYAEATPLLREVFAGSPRVAGIDGPPRALVWNATEEPLASEVALLEVTDAGFVAMSAGDWPSVQQVTRINGIGYFPGGLSYSGAAAEALRLAGAEEFGDVGTKVPETGSPAATPAATMPPPDRTPWADVDIVFGQDYQPCPADNPDCLEEQQ